MLVSLVLDRFFRPTINEKSGLATPNGMLVKLMRIKNTLGVKKSAKPIRSSSLSG